MLLSLSDVGSEWVLFKKSLMQDYFGFDVGEVFVVLLSRDDFSRLGYDSWVKGFSFPKERLIFVLNIMDFPDQRDFFKVVVHELSHIFYMLKFGSNLPKWFNEGLAMYFAEQEFLRTDINLRVLLDSLKDSSRDIYSVAGSFIDKVKS